MINVNKYKSYLINKLSDTLEIAGFNIIDLRSALIQKILPISLDGSAGFEPI